MIAAESDITLAALLARLLAERGVRADTGMLSRFFIGEDIAKSARRPQDRIAQRGPPAGELKGVIRVALIGGAPSSSTKPGKDLYGAHPWPLPPWREAAGKVPHSLW